MQLSTTASSKKNLLQKGYQSKVSGRIILPKNHEFHLGAILADTLSLLEQPLPLSLPFFSGGVLPHNVRGRQYGGRTKEEEILRLEGNLQPLSSDEKELALSLQLKSVFNSFQGRKGILYQSSGLAPGMIQEAIPNLSLRGALGIVPVNWQKISFGIELFKNSFFGSMLGSSPSIFKRLYLEIDPEKIEFVAEESELKQKGELPLEHEKFFEALDQICQKRKIGSNLREKICKSLQ